MMLKPQLEVTDREEMKRILASSNIGRLATGGADGYPYITPVNFVFFKEFVYFHSSPKGEKMDNIGRDPRVCFEVDIPLAYLEVNFNPKKNPCLTSQLYHCVIIRGKARVALMQAARQYQKRIDIFGKISILTKERRTLQWQKW